MRLGRGMPALAALSAAALAATPAAGKKTQHVPKPGYICTTGEESNSNVTATRILDEQGAQISARMEWQARIGDSWQPKIHGIWSVEGPEPLNVAGGFVIVSWSPQPRERQRRPPKRWLELTTSSHPDFWPRPAFSSGEKASETPTVWSSYGDIAALARGSDRLFLSLRDKRGVIQAETTLEKVLFSAGESSIRQALERLASLSADFRSKCEYADDVDPEIILV